VASLIRQESEFNPAAISHAKAMGLMQLLPNVGKGLAKELQIHHFSTDELLVAIQSAIGHALFQTHGGPL